MLDVEQEARIALLQHHTSQMQSYRVNILTGVVVILMIVEVWLRVPTSNRTLTLVLIMSGGLGAIIAIIAFYIARIVWYGQLAASTTSVSKQPQTFDEPLIRQLDRSITTHAECEAQRKGERKVDWVLKWLARHGEHRNVDQWLLMGPIIFGVVMILSLISAPALGLGPGAQIMVTDSYPTSDFTSILSQILLVAATVLVAVATYFVFRATNEMAHNVIRPFLVMRASTRDERDKDFTSHKFPGVSDEVLRSFIEKRGITVENVGLGPAVNGTVTARVEGKTMSSTFLRLYKSEAASPFRYLYPSPVSPQIEIPGDVNEISVEAQYYDVADKHYCQKPQRIKI